MPSFIAASSGPPVDARANVRRRRPGSSSRPPCFRINAWPASALEVKYHATGSPSITSSVGGTHTYRPSGVARGGATADLVCKRE